MHCDVAVKHCLLPFHCVPDLFIQGYDNSESFIITQDPLESTTADFWRMVSEQSISTLVMLSDVSTAQPFICLDMPLVQD